MPQFSFSVAGSSRAISAHEANLPNATAALAEAVRYASRVLGGEPELLLVDEDWTIEVADALGLVLLTILVSAIRSPAVTSR